MPDYLDDLRRSGLSDETIDAMQVRSVTAAECQKLLGWDGVPTNGGYLIPYFDIDGKRTRFFRIRFIPALVKPDGDLIRYAQPKGSTTRAYLPPLPAMRRLWRDTDEPLVITEGEKKAAKACQEGILTVGLGGVNSWMRRKFRVSNKKVSPADEGFCTIDLLDVKEICTIKERVAEELIDLPLRRRDLLICFDNDGEINPNVQHAAFKLSCWAYHQDPHDVQQILLPRRHDGSKQGLDDFLISNTEADFWSLERTRVEPEYIKSWLRDELDRTPNRAAVRDAARAVSNSLLNRGALYKDDRTSRYFYFDSNTNHLHEFEVDKEALNQLNCRTFGTILHRNYDLGPSDKAVLGKVLTYLAHSPALRLVTPRRVSYAAPDALYYQISESRMARASAEGIQLLTNGTDDVLFLSGQIAPLDEGRLLGRLIAGTIPFPPMWLDTVKEMTTLQPMNGLTIEETRLFLAAQCYLNPWFRRWRGLSLPIEIFNAEASSGKSYAYKLRRGILTGRQSLDHMPTTQGDWQVAITHAPGIWVGDNIDRIPKELEPILSDGLCHYVTEDDPMISIRKLHVTNVQYKAPIDCTFAFTCIKTPFYKPDIIQRSFTFHLKAIPESSRISGWVDQKLLNREEWIYDQLLVSQRFLAAARDHWQDDEDHPHTRLKHFDQALHLMGIALGQSEMMDGLIPKLKMATRDAIAESDPAMSALRAFADEARLKERTGMAHRLKPSAVKDIIERAGDRFEHVRVLKSAESFGKYLAQHETDVLNSCGIRRVVEKNQTWLIVEPSKGD